MMVILLLWAIGVCLFTIFALWLVYKDDFEPEDCTWYEADMCAGGDKCKRCTVTK